MNWLTNFIRPKIRSFVAKQDVPENLWHKCPSCEAMLFHRDFEKNLNVCYHCDHHMKFDIDKRLEQLFDGGQYDTVELPKVPADPLKFRDKKRYADRIKEHQGRTGQKDALVIAKGTIGGQKAVIAAMNFDFMGGSMGAAVGSGILKAAKLAVDESAAFITIAASGGARMQEGAISLMQMPRTVLAVSLVKKAGLPYIVLLTNPTTGGVSASFAMIGDIHIAEPGATIGFAGKRVIQETIREDLPDDFQTSEYLLEHGMVDMVVSRADLPGRLGLLLNLLMDKKVTAGAKGKGGKTGGKKDGEDQEKLAASDPENTLRSYQAMDNEREAAVIKGIPSLKLEKLMDRPLSVNAKNLAIEIDPANNNVRMSIDAAQYGRKSASSSERRAAG